MRRILPISVTIIGVCFVCPCAMAAIVSFESVPTGTIYGSPAGHIPGQVVLTEDNIDMSVEEFHLGSWTGFDRAEVGGWGSGAFPTTPLTVGNINLRFDMSNLAFAVNSLTLDYHDFGGGENIAVNDNILYELGLLTDTPTNIAPGVTCSIVQDGGPDKGTIVLAGFIDSFTIGGQELVIDNLIATPEPATMLLLATGTLAVMNRKRKRIPAT